MARERGKRAHVDDESTARPASSAIKASSGRVEWPMVKMVTAAPPPGIIGG